MSHEDLCRRARKWLRGSRRCEPVFSGIGSCTEVPDAIGWSSCHRWMGSTVVECKTSVSDFHRDKGKYLVYEDPAHRLRFPASRVGKKEAAKNGYNLVTMPSMGDYRFFMCEPGVLSADLVIQHSPEHGLLYVEDKRVKVMIDPLRRAVVDRQAEIRYLRFAIINHKLPYIGEDHA